MVGVDPCGKGGGAVADMACWRPNGSRRGHGAVMEPGIVRPWMSRQDKTSWRVRLKLSM